MIAKSIATGHKHYNAWNNLKHTMCRVAVSLDGDMQDELLHALREYERHSNMGWVRSILRDVERYLVDD